MNVPGEHILAVWMQHAQMKLDILIIIVNASQDSKALEQYAMVWYILKNKKDNITFVYLLY